MNSRFAHILFISLTIVLFLGCEKKEEGIWNRQSKDARTVFIYMAADNSLGQYGYDEENIENLIKGATAANIGKGRIVVYQDPANGTPRLLGIHAGSNGLGKMEVLRSYPEQNSAEASTLVAAIADMKRYAPASSYGLILWSHGLNWQSSEKKTTQSTRKWDEDAGVETTQDSDPKAERLMRIPGLLTRSFAEDQNTGTAGEDAYMEISDLATALPTGMFDYIIFDACYMGSVEVAYSLKDKTNYLVASPAEILANGMPYDRILSHLFAVSPRLGAGGVAQEFYDFYAAYDPYGDGDIRYKSATIALYDCTAMERLAEVMSRIIHQEQMQLPLSSAYGIQYYDRTNSLHMMYDLRGFVRALLAESDPLREEFERAEAAVVQYKATTGRIFSMLIDPAKYSGITTYIPLLSLPQTNVDYQTTDWYKRVYGQ